MSTVVRRNHKTSADNDQNKNKVMEDIIELLFFSLLLPTLFNM